MKTTDSLKNLLEENFESNNSLIKQKDISEIEEGLRKLDKSERKGYTIPQLDTIGMNLHGKYAYNFKGL